MDQLNPTENQPNSGGNQVRTRSRQIIQSFEGRLSGNKTRSESIADYFSNIFGSTGFLIFSSVLFVVWIGWNLGWIPGLPVFDPFPFNLLTMAVSLEAIFLSIFVLMSQSREAQIDKLRSEVDLQINMIAEQEITKILSLMTILLEKNGIDLTNDPEIQKMLKRIDLWHIEKKISEQLSEKTAIKSSLSK